MRTPHRYKGAARNLAAEAATGDWLFFMDSDNLAKPTEISTFVSVAQRTGCDLVTCNVGLWDQSLIDADPSQPAHDVLVVLGFDSPTGLVRNQFGDTNGMIRREAFLAIGGFDSTYGARLEDWDFYLRAKLAGLRSEVIFEPQFWYRSNPERGPLFPVEAGIAFAQRYREVEAAWLNDSNWELGAMAAIYYTRWEQVMREVYGDVGFHDLQEMPEKVTFERMKQAETERDRLKGELERIEGSHSFRLAKMIAAAARGVRRILS